MLHARKGGLGLAPLLVAVTIGVVFGQAPVSMSAEAQPPGLRFYAPLDEHARGILLPQRVGIEAIPGFERVPGKVGRAAAVPPAVGVQFPIAPFLSNEEGSVAVWVKVNWHPKETATRMLIQLRRFGSLRRWQAQQYLTYTLWYHHIDEKHDYGCTAPLTGWASGQWRHLAITWSWSQRRRTLYVDGVKVREAPIKRVPNVVTTLQIGPDAEAVDELCVYGIAVDADEVQRLYAAGRDGKPAFDFRQIPRAAGAIERLPDSEASRPPTFVNWSFDGAEQRANGIRGEVTLHGWWRWQRGKTLYDPPNDSQWVYRKVPAHSHYTESFPVRDEEFRIIGANDARVGKRRLDGIPQWCEREFVPPAKWRGRRIVLKVDSLVYESAIFLNGRLLDALPRLNLGGDYDITTLLRWDRPNRLTVFSSGVDGNVTLASVPEGPAIEDAWLVTSWREKSVTAHLRVRGGGPQTASVRVEIRNGSEPVKTLADLRAGSKVIDLSARWENPVCWSLNNPHLYTYRVQLRSTDGALLDETLPTRFGFREIWIDGGDFYLNGRPIHFIGHSNSHLTTAAELGDPEYLRYSLRQWRKAGMNCVTPWQGASRYPTFHPLLDVADEMGMAMFPVVGLPSGVHAAETPQLRAYWHSLYRRYMRRYRQHPSVLGWMIGSGSHIYDFCPAVLDGRHEPDTPKAAPLRATWAFAEGVDSTRPIFGLSNGNIGPVWTSMAYQGFDVDLQERENWPMRWAEKRHKPLMPCEFSLPYYRDWFARSQRRSGRAQYRPANTQSLATEYAAMFLGPSAYEAEPLEYLKTIQTSPGKPRLSKACWEVKKLFADTLRAWRAYGMSFVYHAEVPSLFDGRAPSFPTVAKRDPRRVGATPENLHGSLQAKDELSEFGRRVRDATAPLMAFIGGADGRFTLKNHAYWSGEAVKKALVIVNETDENVGLDAQWALRDGTGKAVVSGKLNVSVSPGRQEARRALIQFETLAVTQRTDYTLTVSARAATTEKVAVPRFLLTVFPADRPQLVGSVPPVLFDPVGDTRAALTRLGVKTEPTPQRLPAHHRLIIGRRALGDEANRQRLIRAGFDEAVAKGMRVLVFEQRAPGWEGRLLGLRMKRLATRRAFIRAPSHPIFEGLAESDFRYLRGDSDLIGPYPDPGPMPKAYPVHFWHWGNDSIVATYTLEKPQVGAARALLDCGFDLAEAAMLETSRGQGLLLFCQVDVTNRVGRDPVSTRLVRNLVRYLAKSSARPPASRTLSQLTEAHPPRASFEGYLSDVPALPGIHAGDVFFREKLRLPALDPNSSTPLFAHVEDSGWRYWITSLSAAKLETDWQRAKRGRIEAALRFLNGERVAIGPMMRESGRHGFLYPHNWTRLPKMTADFDPYVYWRW